MTLEPNKKLDIREILKDLDKYVPKRRGWHWREGRNEKRAIGDFEFLQTSEGLKNYIPLPGARGIGGIDPQPDCVITTEIASGRFEDDIRRMRMAAWNGADHIMVIRTAGQSHYDSLIEGTPQGIGGITVTRKQIRATRKACDLIEEEVGRPINFHSYISGVAGPDIAVMFAEEGVNGAHQDPQYNILYRNINMVRSFVDACEAKKIMAWADILQIDGAHNANATAMKAWKVRPELMVQHAINSIFSRKVGIEPENIALSTVPPTAPPAPCMRIDLPYAVALRDFFHAVEEGFFIDSGNYPERNGDGIPRDINDGIGAGMVFERDEDYFAPVSVHYGYNNVPPRFKSASEAIGGDTFEERSKIIYIDELDELDNVNVRLKEVEKYFGSSLTKPEVEWAADGIVSATLFLPVDERTAEFAAVKCGEKMGLGDVTVVHKRGLHPSEGTLVEIKGRVAFEIDLNELVIPEKAENLSHEEIRGDVEKKPMLVVAGTAGNDEHSVGLKETLDIKHGGIEGLGIKYIYL